MSSNRTEPRSIATQLVLLFTICAALLLSCGLGVFYWIVVRHAFEEDNAVLADKLAAIRTDLKQSNGSNTVDRELKNRRVGEPVVYWMRIIDPAGSIVTETPGMDRLLPPAPAQTACQVCPGLPRLAVAMTVGPLICQVSTSPALLWNRMSARPSPL